MKKAAITFTFLLAILSSQSQKIYFTALGAMSNYRGDIQSATVSFKNMHAAVGAGVYVELNEKIYLRSQLVFAKVAGTDAGTVNRTRNLSFVSPITEVHLAAEYDLFNIYERGATPYLMAGIGYFKFNPYAYDSLGHRIYLQPLGTEGQGFYQRRTKYNLGEWAIPFGAGIKLAIDDNTMLRFELIMRKTFTDYLDDVSTTYADRSSLLANNGAKAVEMAFRAGEYKSNLTYPRQGTIRGNPAIKDYYYTMGATISFRLGAREDRTISGYKSKVSCPAGVY